MEELELDSSTFWRDFDSVCRSAYRDSTKHQYERITLLVLYIWANRRNEELLHETDLAPFERMTTTRWVGQLRHVREQLNLTKSQLVHVDSVPAEFITSAFRFLSGVQEIHGRTAAYFFDYRFMRLAEQETGRHRFLSHFSASLANTINPPKFRLVDVFCETGDLFATGGNERWRRSLSSFAHSYIFQVGSLDLEVRMRLSLHEKHTNVLQMLRAGERSSRAALFRVDPPARRTFSSLLSGSVFEDISSPLHMLTNLQSDFGAQTILMVVAGSERTTNRHAILEVRKSLLEEGMLAAVIDFPRAPSNRVDRTAWLIHSNPVGDRNAVLMINANAMEAPSSRQEYGSLAEFSGRIVSLFLDERISPRWATSSHEDSAAHYRYLFDREFANGYRDVNGLCRVVSTREIEASGYVLQAQQYVMAAPESTSLSGIDSTPLLDLLHPSAGSGRTIYLIGNNGEGKSLLLREIAQLSSIHQRKTIGISCSTSDRFPLKSDGTPGFENFIYEGTRTSDQVSNLKRFATDICRKFIQIHRCSERLHVFDKVIGLIDFNARRYLMPLKASGNPPNSRGDWIIDHTVEVGSDALVNQERTDGINASSMQIALMRSDSNGVITPFRDLSSGEQQIVSLVVKIIAHAEQRCLFLVDEPEISLHVSWQRVLPRVLSVICRAFSCSILVATHSPLLISSVSGSESVCLSARRQRLIPILPPDRRSVESVLFKGFHTHTANNRMIHERCAVIVADAIGIMNRQLPDKERLRPLLSELGDMRRRVSEASEQLDRAGIERSLDVIRTARQAIQELTSAVPNSTAEEAEN
ncbi:AAA family ATPase [Stenotrophomonas rhizophila]